MTEPVDPEVLQDQRDLLALVRERETDAAALKADLVSLEVACLTADAAVKAGRTGAMADINPAVAAEIVQLLGRLRPGGGLAAVACESASDELPPSEERSRYEVASRALSDWLDAANPTHLAPSKAQLVLRLIMLGIVVAVIWAAVKVHLALLLLLPPIVVPYSMLMNSRDDSRWRRAGAKQHFDGTRLAAPVNWDEESVRARLIELERGLAGMRQAAGERALARKTAGKVASAADNLEALPYDESVASGGIERVDESASRIEGAMTEADAKRRLAELVSEHRLTTSTDHGLAPGVEAWLEKLATAYRARQTMNRTAEARKVAETEAGEAREQVFRFLARRGAAPSGGDASTEALTTSLETLARE